MNKIKEKINVKSVGKGFPLWRSSTVFSPISWKKKEKTINITPQAEGKNIAEEIKEHTEKDQDVVRSIEK